MEGPGGLSERQLGFRNKRSTLDAIEIVVQIAREAIRWEGGSKEYCAVVTLDVKNAFNTASWPKIIMALESFRVPKYLQRTICDYFRDRWLIYKTDVGEKRYRVTCGVPQGSVLGPTLWNAMYNGVLGLSLPQGTTIVGYADDLALVVVAKTIEILSQNCSTAVGTVTDWLEENGLSLAIQKTESVLITSRKKLETFSFEFKGQIIQSKPNLHYLGILIDARLTFKDHLTHVNDKAARINMAVSRLLSNMSAVREPKRRLLARVTSSVILYAAPVWASSLQKSSYAAGIVSTYRLSALRVACAFRTISADAICVIASMPPIELLADEMRRLRAHASCSTRHTERQNTILVWQNKWDTSQKGRWTHKLITKIAKWVERKHGVLDFQPYSGY